MRRELPGGFELDDDRGRIDVDAVHDFLANHSYWAKGRPRDVVERLVQGAQRVIGLYAGDRQIGFSRTVSDGYVVSYLADVYVLPEFRGRGLGACPESEPGRLTGVTRRDAASSVAPICLHIGAPCVLASRHVPRVIHRGHFPDRPLGVELVRFTVEEGPYARTRWLLHTADAHALYERFGFGPAGPRFMERAARPGT